MTVDRKWEFYEEYLENWVKEVLRLKDVDSVPCSFKEFMNVILEESEVF